LTMNTTTNLHEAHFLLIEPPGTAEGGTTVL
jgi:hypothetical protein